MTRKSSFRIGLVFTPKSLVSVGVLNGNSPEAYEFMRQIQPLINDFINKVRREASYKLDKFVTREVRRNQVPGRCNDDA